MFDLFSDLEVPEVLEVLASVATRRCPTAPLQRPAGHQSLVVLGTCWYYFLNLFESLCYLHQEVSRVTECSRKSHLKEVKR